MKIPLMDITLVTIDGVDPELPAAVMQHCMETFDFGAAKMFSYKQPQNKMLLKGLEFIEIPKLDYFGYNAFVLSDLAKYVQTEFCLIVQGDGFISNPLCWRNAFLRYDYIGAPWEPVLNQHYPDNSNRVGNGGFSIRSKRFLNATGLFSDLYEVEKHVGLNKNEDFFLVKTHFRDLQNMGMVIAPLDDAIAFSIETPIPEYPEYDNPSQTFGFHGYNDHTIKIIDNVKKKYNI